MNCYYFLYLNSTRDVLNQRRQGVLLITILFPSLKNFYYLLLQTVNTELNFKLLEVWSCFQVHKALVI